MSKVLVTKCEGCSKPVMLPVVEPEAEAPLILCEPCGGGSQSLLCGFVDERGGSPDEPVLRELLANTVDREYPAGEPIVAHVWTGKVSGTLLYTLVPLTRHERVVIVGSRSCSVTGFPDNVKVVQPVKFRTRIYGEPEPFGGAPTLDLASSIAGSKITQVLKTGRSCAVVVEQETPGNTWEVVRWVELRNTQSP